jgi:hypothetical protein
VNQHAPSISISRRTGYPSKCRVFVGLPGPMKDRAAGCIIDGAIWEEADAHSTTACEKEARKARSNITACDPLNDSHSSKNRTGFSPHQQTWPWLTPTIVYPASDTAPPRSHGR